MGNHANNRSGLLARIYCDGVTSAQGGGLQTDNPWDQTTNTQEYDAWDTGWLDSDGGAVDLSCCGYPVAGAPSPELTENRY